MVGEVPRGLPSFTWPQLEIVQQMWPAALGIALMSFTESIAAGRAFAEPQEPRPLPNRELLALGLANVGGGLFGAMPAGGGTSQTAVNRGPARRPSSSELVTAAGGARHPAAACAVHCADAEGGTGRGRDRLLVRA